MTKVLVTGATGNNGSLLTPRLASHDDLEVSAFVRDLEKAAFLKDAGVELFLGTFEEPATLKKAVRGQDIVVLITPNSSTAATQASNVLKAAREAGVRKIVRLSVIKAGIDSPTENTRFHGQTDDEILDSGLTYVILRPHFSMQNFFLSAESIATEGAMYWGMGDGKLGMMDMRDVIDSFEKSVISDEFDNQIMTLTGPESISFHDVADIMTVELNRECNYVAVPPAAVEQSLREQLGDQFFAKDMRQYSEAYSDNWGDFTTDGFERMTGHNPRSLAVFCREVFSPALQQGG